MRGCIFGAGSYDGEALRLAEGALIIAADGGLCHTERFGLAPTLVIGDFDSLGKIPTGDNVILHPVMKDDTDMALAVREAVARGCDEIILFGGTGGRLDHTLANMALLLSLAKKGISAYLVGKEGVVTALTAGEKAVFAPECKGILSVLAATDEARGVTLGGLLYPLSDGLLTNDHPLGVSNHFVGEEASVSLSDGTVFLLWEEVGNPLPLKTAL